VGASAGEEEDSGMKTYRPVQIRMGNKQGRGDKGGARRRWDDAGEPEAGGGAGPARRPGASEAVGGREGGGFSSQVTTHLAYPSEPSESNPMAVIHLSQFLKGMKMRKKKWSTFSPLPAHPPPLACVRHSVARSPRSTLAFRSPHESDPTCRALSPPPPPSQTLIATVALCPHAIVVARPPLSTTHQAATSIQPRCRRLPEPAGRPTARRRAARHTARRRLLRAPRLRLAATLALLQPRCASRLLVSQQHWLHINYVAHRRDVVFWSHRVDHSSRLVFQTSRERQSRPQQLVGINSD
jgi:hypothetical protein